MIRNPVHRTIWVWAFMTLVFIFGIFAPSILGLEGMHGGYAISFFCIILAITGIVVVIIYLGRASALDKMLCQENLLIHWSYTPEQWQTYTEKAYTAEKSERWGLYWLVMVIVFLVCLGFWLFNRDSGTIMILMVLGLAALLAATVWVTTRLDHWQNTKSTGEVYITKEGALVAKTLHLWRGWGARLEDAEYKEVDSIIEITYSVPNRSMRNSHTIRVPVPSGEEKKAKLVVNTLRQKAGLESDNI